MHKIGVVAKQVGISHDTIRLYEHYGLIGTPTRTDSGYRLYDDEAIEKLLFIQNMKQLGFTLNEIKELLDIKATSKKQCTEVRNKLTEKIKGIDERISALENLKLSLKKAIELCSTPLDKNQCPILMATNKGRSK